MSPFDGITLKDRLFSDVELLKVCLNVHHLCIKVLNGCVVEFTFLGMELLRGYWTIIVVVSESDFVLELWGLSHLALYTLGRALQLDVSVRVCAHRLHQTLPKVESFLRVDSQVVSQRVAE